MTLLICDCNSEKACTFHAQELYCREMQQELEIDEEMEGGSFPYPKWMLEA